MEDNFLRDLRNADWTYFLNFSDLDRACKVFNDIVKTVAEKHAPYVTHKIKGKAEAWVTHDFLQSIKERNFLMRRANKSKSTIDWDNFIKKRNQVTKLKNKLKQEYFNNLLSENAKRPKQLWKALKTLVPGGKSSATTLLCLIVGGGVTLQFFENFDPHFILL